MLKTGITGDDDDQQEGIMKKALLAGAAMLALTAVSAPAHAVIITDTTSQSGFTGLGFLPSPYPLTGPDWDFGGAEAALASITRITVELTIYDGDTGPGDFDLGELTLGLDGIDTGLLLDGFLDNTSVTLELTTLAPLNAAAILAALKVDGQLIGTVIDASGSDQSPIFFDAELDTTLTLEGAAAVPEPGTILLLGSGLASLALRRRRRVH